MASTQQAPPAQTEPSLAPAVEEGGATRDLTGWVAQVFRWLAVAMGLFQLYIAGIQPLGAVLQMGVHLLFALTLIFMLYRPARRLRYAGALDALLIAAAVVVIGRVILASGVFSPHETAALSARDTAFAIALTALVFEGSRRAIGLSLPLVALTSIAYVFAGPFLPGELSHPGYSVNRVLAVIYTSPTGIWGLALDVSTTFIFVLVLFGGLLMSLGGGQVFMDLAYSALGRFRGGPAKMAVVASAAFGTMSGSGIANTATTGMFTIPLMKRVGYRGEFAGAVEATASMGGQIMPPVMGIAAFVMAEMLEKSYAEIALAALLPAILYFTACFIVVDLEAAKGGMRGLPKEELPSARRALQRGWYLLLGPALLVYEIMILELSPATSGFAAVTVVVAIEVVVQLLRTRRVTLKPVFDGMVVGTRTGITIAVATALLGVIIGMLDLTGVGLKLSSFLVDLSGGNLFILLILTMIASLILGTGLPTVLTYILLAVLAAPALIRLGVEPLAAHLFVFYYGIIADLTPPTAISCVVAAQIAKADPWKTMWHACRLAIASFIVPFVFVYEPALLLKGPLDRIIISGGTAILGTAALAAGLVGWVLGPAGLFQRVLLIVGGLLLIAPDIIASAIGLVLIAAVGVVQVLAVRRPRPAPSPSAGTE